MEMKKLRVFLATAAMASSFLIVSAGPASADCLGQPVSTCAAVCRTGQGNKYTRPLFDELCPLL